MRKSYSGNASALALVSAAILGSCTLVTTTDGLSGGTSSSSSSGDSGPSSTSGGEGGVDATTEANLVDERLDGQFGAGTFVGTRWVGDHVELAPGSKAGDFLSRIHGVSTGTVWKTLTWSPGAPYGKNLPNAARAETGYRSANFDMAQNVLLLHFDEALDDGSPIGNAVGGTALGGFTAGRIGRALNDTAQGYVRTSVLGSGSAFNFGTESFSWSLWAKTTSACPGNAVYMGIENPGTGLRPHLWLGCTPLNAADGGSSGTLGMNVCTRRVSKEEDCTNAEGAAVVTDGAWHHLAIVKEGHTPTKVSAYVDGKLQGSAQSTLKAPLVFEDGVEFAVGAFSRGDFPADGAFDEAAVWRRALSAAEVLALYRRGAQRLTFQVRACEDSTCSNNPPFTGPGGDAAQAFSDPSQVLTPPVGLAVTASGRFVQYKAHFESDDSAQSPTLYAVTLTR